MRTTTSATGDPAPRGSGFTLIEIMIVISILVTLGAVFMVQIQSVMERTKIQSTRARLQKLALVLEEYRRINASYPPDGIDTEVRNSDGTAVKGSAALYHALSTSFEYREMAAGIPRRRTHPPLLQFAESELSDENEEFPGVREIVDAFGVPLHYDNTENKRFRPQRGEVHYPRMDDSDHPADIRTVPASKGGVEEPDSNQSTGYDLWSHGETGHDVDSSIERRTPIASWSLGKE